MGKLIIEETHATPLVDFSTEHQLQRISGISTPIDSFEFYRPIIEWIVQNSNEIPVESVFQFELMYFNSSSMKSILWLLQQISQMGQNGKNWKISWIVVDDDEFMEESANVVQSLIDIPMEVRHV
jgi:hypothetical protein